MNIILRRTLAISNQTDMAKQHLPARGWWDRPDQESNSKMRILNTLLREATVIESCKPGCASCPLFLLYLNESGRNLSIFWILSYFPELKKWFCPFCLCSNSYLFPTGSSPWLSSHGFPTLAALRWVDLSLRILQPKWLLPGLSPTL